MIAKLLLATAAELLRALRRDGWFVHERKGGHVQLKHPRKPRRVTVPTRAGRTVPLGTLKSALDQAGLTSDELRELL